MDMRTIVRRMFNPALRLAQKHSCARSEEGSVIMETAMSFIMLISFMLIVMETGFLLYSYHFISEAAREGTRYAIVRGSTAGSPAGTACASYGSLACKASSTDVQNFVKNLGFLNPTNMTVTPTWSAFTGGQTCPTTGPCNSPGNLVTVQVQYNFTVSVPVIPSKTYTLSSTAAMIIQN
jgi:Flp pilus assembly protein TadG